MRGFEIGQCAFTGPLFECFAGLIPAKQCSLMRHIHQDIAEIAAAVGERQPNHRLRRTDTRNTDTTIHQRGAGQFAQGIPVVGVIFFRLRIARTVHYRRTNGITNNVPVTRMDVNCTRSGTRGSPCRQRIEQFGTGLFR